MTRGTPWEVPERSPLTYAPNYTTPVLFVVDEQDFRCPPGEAEQYNRVLKVGTSTEMVQLPACGHTGSLDRPVPCRLAQGAALVQWFTRHLRPADRESPT